jgi:4-amino-4-deoxy-L-arabinose transferase-like glycosyltransferase
MNVPSFKRLIPFLCLAGILGLSAFFYFYRLDKESLTTDEYFSLHLARQPLNEIVLNHQGQGNPNTIPPLYDIIMHFWLRVFGSSEAAQRSFSALLGVVSVYLLYVFARLLFDTRTGLLSALFASLSYSWFYFFRMNRCYGLFLCLTLLSLYVFFYHIKNKTHPLSLIILSLINVALIYTHYFAFLIIAIEGLLSVFEWKNNRQLAKNIFLMCFWLALAFAPYSPDLWHDLAREPVLSRTQPSAGVAVQAIRILFALLSPFHVRWNPALSILYVPLIVFGCVRLAKEKSEYFRNRLLYLFLILAVPSAFIYLITHSDRMRYYTPFSFPLLIFLAAGILKLYSLKPKSFVIFPLTAIYIAAFNFADFSDFFRNRLYENWRGAAQYVKSIPGYQEREMVFIFQTRYNAPVFSYYYTDARVADALVDNIVNYNGYDKDLLKFNAKHAMYWAGETTGIGEFFDMLDLFPGDAWIWVMRYHDKFFASDFRKNNNGRYFFHQIILNEELPQIDFFLVKKMPRRD